MPTETGTVSFRVSMGANLKKNTGFGTLKLPARVTRSLSLDAAVYTEVLLGTYSIAAAATQTINLRSFTDKLGDAVTGTGAIALVFYATGNTGKLRIAKGASNGLLWFFGDASDTITLNCGTIGCSIALQDGTPITVDASNYAIDLSNPGSATIAVTAGAIIKTT